MALLKNGCPCPKKECPNNGNCEACVRDHVEQDKDYPVYCMRGLAKKAYGQKATV